MPYTSSIFVIIYVHLSLFKYRMHKKDKSDSDDSQTSQHDWDPYGEELDDIAEELKEIILSDYNYE